MHKNKKGFTLIELLAVIVVLSVILVIASTSVIKSVNNSRNNAFMTSFDNLLGSVKNNIIQQKTSKNVQVECAIVDSVSEEFSDLDYCHNIYDYDSNEYNFYVLGIDDYYFIILTGIGKFSKTDLSQYKNTLSNKGIVLYDIRFEKANNSMFAVIAKNGKVLKPLTEAQVENIKSQLEES